MKEDSKPKSEINLRKLMQKLGLGTNAFAEKCGMSSQSMSQFLRNKSLTTNTIYRIATALDIDPRDMFFPTEEAAEKERKKKEMEKEINIKMKPLGMDVLKQIAGRVPDVIGGNSGGGVDWTNVENAENGGENQQQIIQTSTFCPHCGKKVRVGVVLLPEE